MFIEKGPSDSYVRRYLRLFSCPKAGRFWGILPSQMIMAERKGEAIEKRIHTLSSSERDPWMVMNCAVLLQ